MNQSADSQAADSENKAENISQNAVIAVKRLEKKTQSYFKSENAVKALQKRNDEIGVNKKTFDIPMAEKFLEAIKKTIEEIDNEH